MGQARPAVQEQEPHRRSVADALRPDPERALWRGDWDQPDAAADDVVAAGAVEIARTGRLAGGHDNLPGGARLARRPDARGAWDELKSAVRSRAVYAGT